MQTYNLCMPCHRKCEQWLRFRDQAWKSAESFNATFPCDVYIEPLEVLDEDVLMDDEEETIVDTIEIVPLSEEGQEEEQEVVEKNAQSSSIEGHFSLLCVECGVCSEVLPHLKAYYDHLSKDHMSENGGTCPKCPDMPPFTTEASFHTHMNTHLKFRFPCPDCPAKLYARISLIQHCRHMNHRNPHDRKTRQCFICGPMFPSENHLRIHIHEEHVELVSKRKTSFVIPQNNRISIHQDQTDCFICNQTLATDRLLTRHLYGHVYGVKMEHRFCCDHCGRIFSSRSNFERHIRIHIEGKVPEYKCDICDKSFKCERYLLRHTLRHNMERTLKCDQCEKMFYFSQELMAHKRTHAVQNRRYICSFCDRGFFNKSTRDEHIRIRHTGERRYPCDTCGKSYYRNRELLEHQRSHTGEKPFKCEVCGRIYARKTTLATHMKTHR